MTATGRRKPKITIGLYFALMAAAIALPILAFLGLLLVQLETSERIALERRTEREAQALATGVGRQLQDMTTTLRLLAASPELESGDMAAFHARTQLALRAGSMYMLAVAADGQQFLNTRVPYGTPLGKISNVAALQSALASGRAEVSDVFFGTVSKQWVFNVTLPLEAGLPSGVAALIMTQNAQELGKLSATSGLPPGWSAGLIDTSGKVVVTSSDDSAMVGKELAPGLRARLGTGSGAISGAIGGPHTLIGYSYLPGWSWIGLIWGPIEAAQASILTTWRLLIFGGLAMLALAVGASYVVARRLRASIESIAEMAERLGAGAIVAPAETVVVETERVAVALSEASFDRSEAEDRARFILRELAHRTKNMLTLVQAMMRQTAKQSDTVGDFQGAMTGRLEGLGRSIDLLTAEEWAGVSMRRSVESQLGTFVDREARLEIRGDDFLLKPEAIQNLGLVLHELATNAVKYGAWSAAAGRVVLDWRREDGAEPMLAMTWKEEGGPPVAGSERKGFGSTIIERHAMAAFRGTVELDFAVDGLRWTMVAPLQNLEWKPRDAALAGHPAG